MIPLILIGVVPILTGDIVKANFFPLVPLGPRHRGPCHQRQWNLSGKSPVLAGGMFLAAWSTYGFETRCATLGIGRIQKPIRSRPFSYSGLLCVVVYTLVAVRVPGFFWASGRCCSAGGDGCRRQCDAAVYSGMLRSRHLQRMGVAAVMAKMVPRRRPPLIGAIVV